MFKVTVVPLQTVELPDDWTDTLKAALGSVMVIEVLSVQPQVSVTVTEYVPAVNEVKSCVVAPVFQA